MPSHSMLADVIGRRRNVEWHPCNSLSIVVHSNFKTVYRSGEGKCERQPKMFKDVTAHLYASNEADSLTRSA